MPPLDDTYHPRLWACDECRQVLGVVMRDVNRVRRLWVFCTDRPADQVPAVTDLRRAARGLYKIHGVDSCSGVECSRCGALNAWSMSREAYLQLMSYYQKHP